MASPLNTGTSLRRKQDAGNARGVKDAPEDRQSFDRNGRDQESGPSRFVGDQHQDRNSRKRCSAAVHAIEQRPRPSNK
jgi:hypothetical protein